MGWPSHFASGSHITCALQALIGAHRFAFACAIAIYRSELCSRTGSGLFHLFILSFQPLSWPRRAVPVLPHFHTETRRPYHVRHGNTAKPSRRAAFRSFSSLCPSLSIDPGLRQNTRDNPRKCEAISEPEGVQRTLWAGMLSPRKLLQSNPASV